MHIGRVASRLVLLPFYTTPQKIQLSGPERDAADAALIDTIQTASKAAASIISLGAEIEDAYHTEMASILQRVRSIISPRAATRVHRSYAWLMLATLKVCNQWSTHMHLIMYMSLCRQPNWSTYQSSG